MIYNNIYDYYLYLGQQDKLNKIPMRMIRGINKTIARKCQEVYNKGYKNGKKRKK